MNNILMAVVRKAACPTKASSSVFNILVANTPCVYVKVH